jgi:hypothetical protein
MAKRSCGAGDRHESRVANAFASSVARWMMKAMAGEMRAFRAQCETRRRASRSCVARGKEV